MQQYLSIARKHAASLVCGLVALIAVVLSFIPTGGWFDQLRTDVDQRTAISSTLTTLVQGKRAKPNISGADTPEPLSVFPTADVIQKGADAVGQVRQQSQGMLDTAVKLNEHQPLVTDPPVLPAGDDIARSNFARQYLAAVNDDARIRAWPPENIKALKPSLPELKAGRRVSADDIKVALDNLKAEVDKQYLITSVGSGAVTPESQQQAAAVYDQRSRALPMEMQKDAAKRCKVYLEPGAIKRPEVYNRFVQATTSPPITDVWAAKIDLWIEEDVATGVAYANAGAGDVAQAPVKQIRDLTIKNPPFALSGDPTAGKDDAPLVKAFDVTPSGRVTNGMYDVMQFSLSLDVDATKVPAVIDGLERGQFLTVLSVQATAVDSAEPSLQQFFYGNGPIVRLDLVCEDLYLNNWMSKYQPTVAAAPAGGAPGAPAMPLGFPGLGGPGSPGAAPPTSSLFGTGRRMGE